MNELREFAQHKADFDKFHTTILAISADDVEHARVAWEKGSRRQFRVLADPDLAAIKAYGLLHKNGYRGSDIAIRTAILLDKNGREQWRYVSDTATDVPTYKQVLPALEKLPAK